MKKKGDTKLDDDLRAEYDFYKLKGSVKGKYAKQYHASTNLVLLAPDVARVFPTDEAVNEALRQLMRIAKTQLRHSH